MVNTMNSGSDIEAPVENTEQVKQVETEEKLEREEHIEALLDGNLSRYVSNGIENGRIKILREESNNLKSKSFFPDEGWKILEIAAAKFCKDGFEENIDDMYNYIIKILGEWVKARQIYRILMKTMIEDVEKIREENLNLPPVYYAELDKLVEERTELVEKMKTLAPYLDDEDLAKRTLSEIKTEVIRAEIQQKAKENRWY